MFWASSDKFDRIVLIILASGGTKSTSIAKASSSIDQEGVRASLTLKVADTPESGLDERPVQALTEITSHKV
jgi:hypothetical protein